MTPSWEPAGPQQSFALEMRARREAADLSRHKLAEVLGCTPQWLAKVENHEKAPSEALAHDLDTYFNAPGSFRRLWEQLTEARRQGLVSKGFSSLIEAEKKATEINYYEPLLIPGLFQTIEYARLQMGSGLRTDNLDELVTLRLERQKIFDGDAAPWVFLLIREAVLRDLPPEIKQGQCKKLIDLLDHPAISIQVIPSDAHVFLPTGFQVLRFPEGADVGYVEGSGRNAQMLTDFHAVRRLAVLFSRARSSARPGRETGELIQRLLEGT